MTKQWKARTVAAALENIVEQHGKSGATGYMNEFQTRTLATAVTILRARFGA